MDIKPLQQTTSKKIGRMLTGLLDPPVKQKYVRQKKHKRLIKKQVKQQ